MLGYLDDVIILPSLIVLTVRLIPSDMFAERRIRAEGLWADGKPKKWYFTLPILAIWLFVIFLIIKAIWFYNVYNEYNEYKYIWLIAEILQYNINKKCFEIKFLALT